MEEKKRLKLKVIEDPHEGFLTFAIEEQSHRGKSFGFKDNNFTASNGVMLSSYDFPEIRKGRLFVMGGHTSRDNDYLECSELEFKEYLVAVEEYNATFSCLDIYEIEL